MALDGLASIGYGVAEAFNTQLSRAIVGSGVAVLSIGYGILLLAVARGVSRGRRWSRAPGLATQLIQLPIAWSFRGPETWWFGLLLGTVSATVIVCLLLPSSTAVFVPEAATPPQPPANAD